MPVLQLDNRLESLAKEVRSASGCTPCNYSELVIYIWAFAKRTMTHQLDSTGSLVTSGLRARVDKHLHPGRRAAADGPVQAGEAYCNVSAECICGWRRDDDRSHL